MYSYSISSKIKKNSLLVISFIILTNLGCLPEREPKEEPDREVTFSNPALPGFDSLNSDSLAIYWADAVMQAQGGRANWDKLHYVSWNFFGRRDLWWDKYSGNVRIEIPMDSIIYLTNIHSNKGRVKIKGQEILNQDSLKVLMNTAKAIWINDAYWLFMPFKLKDSGVTLKYLGERTTLKEEPTHALSLTFDNVGVTPNNKYEVFISKKDSLVKQWAFFRNAEQDSASAIWPFDNYKTYGNLKLSANRSDGKGPADVVVYDSMPEAIFTQFDWK